jgi:hypothetical protein
MVGKIGTIANFRIFEYFELLFEVACSCCHFGEPWGHEIDKSSRQQ